jgi:O-antigen/teichoic acid export membrane protein
MPEEQSFLKAIMWAYTANWGEKAFSALFFIILASLLGPRDFGIVSMAMIYVSFLTMFLDQGFASALIQRKNLEQGHLDAVFVTNVVLSLGLVTLGFVFSRAWAALNSTPELAIISSVLSLCIIIRALTLVQTAVLTRQMNFRSLSIRTNFSVLLSGIVGISMAYAGWGVWSLVCQRLLGESIALILLWRMSSWRPGLNFSWPHLSDLMGFSAGNFAAYLALFFDAQAGPIVLGVMFGPAAVGLYKVADRISDTVTTMALASIQGVSFPHFSRLQDQPDELRKSVLMCVQLSASVALPALAGLASTSDSLMAVIGPKWVPASDALKVMCGFGYAIVLTCFTVPLMQARGKTRQVAVLEWARTIVGLIVVVGAGILVRDSSVQTQLLSITTARVAVMVFLVTPVFLFLLLRLAGISLHELSLSIMPSVLSSISVAISVALVIHLLPVGVKLIVELIAETLVGGVIGLTVLLSTDAQLRTSATKLLRIFRA